MMDIGEEELKIIFFILAVVILLWGVASSMETKVVVYNCVSTDGQEWTYLYYSDKKILQANEEVYCREISVTASKAWTENSR